MNMNDGDTFRVAILSKIERVEVRHSKRVFSVRLELWVHHGNGGTVIEAVLCSQMTERAQAQDKWTPETTQDRKPQSE